MSRLDELKKQYPELNITLFDLFKRFDKSKSYKYFPLLCKVLGSRYNFKEVFKDENSSKIYLELETDLSERGIDVQGLSLNEKYTFHLISEFFSKEEFKLLSNFMELIDGNKIEKKDISQYSNIEEIRNAIMLAEIKLWSKELEKQIIKEYEDDTWLILRPLTFASSAKYGSGTKWCTTYQIEKQYFERYWRRGILVYFINKKTGYKVGGFKSLDGDDELSFWSASDKRVDFLETEIDGYLFPVVKKVFASKDTNKNLCSSELQESVHQECLSDLENVRRQISFLQAVEEPNGLTEPYPQPIENQVVNHTGDYTTLRFTPPMYTMPSED
jgi:hypothetical protein